MTEPQFIIRPYEPGDEEQILKTFNLVFREVWGYPPGRVLATIGYVPVEEYMFFLLQPLLAGATLYWLLGRAIGRGTLRYGRRS